MRDTEAGFDCKTEVCGVVSIAVTEPVNEPRRIDLISSSLVLVRAIERDPGRYEFTPLSREGEFVAWPVCVGVKP